MPTLVDLTDPSLNISPKPQSTDVKVCTLTLPTVAEGDKFAMSVRETFSGVVIGGSASSSKNGIRFEPNVATNQVTIWQTEKTEGWYKGQSISEANRIKKLTGTFLQEDAAGLSYVWSGEIDIRWPFAIGYTRP